VRAGASPDAHIVASVGPESRVQLGEVRGTWRRLHSRDINGWVDLRRASFAEARASRGGGLAAR
jgi:SH3-like domain-containing protein